MLNERKIGKAVWLLESITNYTWKLNKDKKYIVIGVVEPGKNFADGTENTDWCEHLVIKDENGTISHIREYEAIVCPEVVSKYFSDTIYHYLQDNGLYPDNVYENSEECIQVSIDWGDWKHDHGWCDDLMNYIGWSCGDVIVTEENGSDCYSADHYYYKSND